MASAGPSERGASPARARGRLALAAAALAVAAGCGSGGDDGNEAGGAGTAAGARPNVVVVMTDDHAQRGWRRDLPRVDRLVARPGAVFGNTFVTTPLCCPSRATFLTGQYAHNHGVLENHPGYPDLHEPASVLPEWLRRAGYRTGHVGKWLNGYHRAPGTDGGAAPPPGWDEWDGLMQAAYYNYDLSVNGRVDARGEDPDDHANTLITRYGLRFLRAELGGPEPFFLSLAYVAPHVDRSSPAAGGKCGEVGFAVPAPEDVAAADELAADPPSPAVNEADVSDKPTYVRRQPRLPAAELEAMRLRIGCERASLRVVDRGVARVLGAIRRAGELENTLVIFTSDHGFLHGEHRIRQGKSLPYDEAVRVPLAIRPPGPARSARIEAVAANIDLAPTILDYAGARPCLDDGACRELDGRSLRPLVDGARTEWPRPREVLIENTKRAYQVCSWSAVRTKTEAFAQYGVSYGAGCGEREFELYDLRQDPAELHNLADDPGHRDTYARLKAARDRLSKCAGSACR